MKPEDTTFELLALEVRRLFHLLGAAAETIHEDLELSAAHRAVLEHLSRGGPQTVPMLARGRKVSRQHIQVLANRLVELELVEAAPNPQHKRSPILRLTDAGRRRFDAMRTREHRAIGRLELPVSERELTQATSTLRRLNALFAEPGWRR